MLSPQSNSMFRLDPASRMSVRYHRTVSYVTDSNIMMRHETAGQRAFSPTKARLMERHGWTRVKPTPDQEPAADSGGITKEQNADG